MTALKAAFAEARRGLRLRRRGMVLTGIGIALASAMLSAAAVVGVGLGGGFERSARAADLPDIIVRFNPQAASVVNQRISALPDIASYSTRFELTQTHIAAGGQRRDDAVAEVMTGNGRPGYAVVSGRGLASRGSQVLVELAFAQAWHLHLGSTIHVGDLGRQRVVGFTEAPDNVGYPLAKPRYYLSRAAIDARFGGPDPNPRVNLAEIWLRDPRYANEVLVQARSTSFGLRNLQFATRSGVRVLLDQAAGIVIDLLVALSIIALVTASVMLAASARAEVQRRLGAIGVRRAVGASRGHIALSQGFEAMMVAVPAAGLGLVAGVLATYGADDRLLTMLNEPPPGTALALPLAGAVLASVAIPVLGAAWPAWRAAGRSPVGLLRGGELVAGGRGSEGRRWRRPPDSANRRPRGGLAALGARLVVARRARLAATVVTLGLSTGFVLLMLALASALSALETDPQALGKRYQLTASMPASSVPRVRLIPGVAAAAPRYETQAADSFFLGETIDVIAYPGDHTRFEAPPLAAGRRLNGPRQAEVGVGLADALGLSPGSTLAIALSSGSELRLRVSGLVSSLDHDGRVAYIPARALLAAAPAAPFQVAVELKQNANPSQVSAALVRLGAAPTLASGATARGVPLVNTLRTILLADAIVEGLVCLYALIQASTLTVQERRRTVAVLRACGAGASAVRRLLLGATLALVVPAAVVGIVLERFVFGPALSHLAANYAALALDATTAEVLATLAGLALASAVAVLWVARQAGRESVVSGLASR
ncbi:MAG: putative transport system permease protein [Solirubrobacteraceae bacterium]|nr:putative transport system permease protein [Solirubrobacteraceae bacterium]